MTTGATICNIAVVVLNAAVSLTPKKSGAASYVELSDVLSTVRFIGPCNRVDEVKVKFKYKVTLRGIELVVEVLSEDSL